MNSEELQKKLESSRWFYNPWFVLFMLLFVLGPIALPLLYKSPRFSRKWKIIWTVATLLMAWLMVEATIRTWQVLQPLWQAVQASLNSGMS